jgi:hypothetical protein
MKRLTRTALALAAIAADRLVPAATARLALDAHLLLRRAVEGVETNPLPSLLALGTVLATACLRATRGRPTVNAPVAVKSVADGESAVLRRALDRATRTQLVSDQIALEHRCKALPEAVRKAERDLCYTENAVAEAERALGAKASAHADALDRLDALRDEQATAEAETAAIRAELANLAARV